MSHRGSGRVSGVGVGRQGVLGTNKGDGAGLPDAHLPAGLQG